MTPTSSRASGGARPTDVRWTRRPIIGWLVRAAGIGGPFVASLAVAWLLTSITPQPDGAIPAVLRWLAIAAVSSLVLVVMERVGRRLMPIAGLFEMSLVFPDRAPSRFRVALRTGTTTQLHRRIGEARSGSVAYDTPAESAARVIELVAALRVHDHTTRGHSERVRTYTQMIADEMGLPEDERDRLRWAGLLHDVGKLFVPGEILNKTGRLTAEEYDIVKTHPESGRQIIEPLIPWLGDAARAVWEHHEKWDGTGYPRGLAGEEISLAARVVAVADVYDVMTSARSYKQPVSPREARAELARCAGTHFDPAVVRAFLELSIGSVRRAAGPLSWIAQLALFPTAVFSSAQAAGSAVVLTGALGASSADMGARLANETFTLVDPRAAVESMRPAADDELWQLAVPIAPPSTRVPIDVRPGDHSDSLITVSPPVSAKFELSPNGIVPPVADEPPDVGAAPATPARAPTAPAAQIDPPTTGSSTVTDTTVGTPPASPSTTSPPATLPPSPAPSTTQAPPPTTQAPPPTTQVPPPTTQAPPPTTQVPPPTTQVPPPGQGGPPRGGGKPDGPPGQGGPPKSP